MVTDQSAASTRYAAARHRLGAGLSSPDHPAALSVATDDYFRLRLGEIEPETTDRDLSFSILALGGYGRRELNLFSDIDLLVLYADQVPPQAETLVQLLLHPLWDLGLDLGHGVRSTQESLILGRDNFEALTSMLDARLVAGSPAVASSFLHELQGMLSELAGPYTGWLRQQFQHRGRTFSDASGLLEPDLKEAWGGLRDYHHLLWLGRVHHNAANLRDLELDGVLSHQERVSLQAHVSFVMQVRNHLHALSGKRNDRLYLELQPEIASTMGIAPSGDVPAVERFLTQLHRNMTGIKVICRSFWSIHLQKPAAAPPRDIGQSVLPSAALRVDDGLLWFKNPERIPADSSLLMCCFRASALSGVALSWETRRLVEEFLFLVDHDFRSSPVVRDAFFSILVSDQADRVLESMLETGLLGAYLPELGKVQDLMQYDAYHLHPVGRHLVESVAGLIRFQSMPGAFLAEYLEELSGSLEIRLAALLHDVGKNAPDHAARGAALVATILDRLGLDAQAAQRVCFLVRHHLLLVETATRRDLEEEGTIMDCAAVIRDVPSLSALTLLTWADAMATGPKAWNPWMENLLRELFFKVLRLFQQGPASEPHEFHKLATARDRIRSLLAGRMSDEQIEDCLDVMPGRYLLHYAPAEVVGHLELVRRVSRGPHSGFVLEARPIEAGNAWELALVARGKPGLFTPMAGVLSLRGINIYAADLNRWSDGTVVDVFKVGQPPDPLYAEDTWDRVRQELSDVLHGRLALEYRLSVKTRQQRGSAVARSGKVLIDNRSSDFYTLVEVIADDRTGLLHALGRTLNDLQLSIAFATIATHRDQVADVFYVRDNMGRKVTDTGQVREIRNALQHSLDRLP